MAASDTGSSSESASMLNLAKNIVGAGVLALPSGAAQVVVQSSAAGIDSSSAAAFVLFLYIAFGALNALGFYLIGEACALTGATTYREVWRKTLGDDFAWLPSVASVICCFTGMVACASVIGDVAVDLSAGLPGSPHGAIWRDELLCGLSAFILLPLCLLPSLAPLAFASLLGMLGVLGLVVVMMQRMSDGSYQFGGEFFDTAAWKPELLAFSMEGGSPEVSVAAARQPAGAGGPFADALLLTALLSNAFSAHYNSPAIFAELQVPEDAAPGRGMAAKLNSFAIVTWGAFTLALALFLAVTSLGIGTFGSAVQPSILNNYSSADSLAAFARGGLGLCVLFEFPLLERPFRATIVELLGVQREVGMQPWVVAASVGSACALACVPGLGLDKITAVGGALGASFLIYIAPALMSLRLSEMKGPEVPAQEVSEEPPALRAVRGVLLQGLATFGAFLGLLGAVEAFAGRGA